MGGVSTPIRARAQQQLSLAGCARPMPLPPPLHVKRNSARLKITPLQLSGHLVSRQDETVK